MEIGVPRQDPARAPVAATPQSVAGLLELGHTVHLERGAGAPALISDEDYERAGARLVDRERAWSRELVLTAHCPSPPELELMADGAVLVGRLDPARRGELPEALNERGLTALALDAVPRLSRAQAMDPLSSQAGLAGYRAVIEAAAHLGRPLGGQVSAAGKLAPATVLVIGAGVAGLAAIGAARALGASVRGTDVRPEAAQQVESLGARFVPMPSAQAVSDDGYAKQMGAEQAAAAATAVAEQAAQADVVITSAAVPGRRAPVLLDSRALEAMRPGAVVVDLAAATGGNTESTVADEVVTTDGGVIIVGHTDLAARLPQEASRLYARNLLNLLALMTPSGEGDLVVDLDDPLVRAITVCHRGQVLWPPPAVKVRAEQSVAEQHEQAGEQEDAPAAPASRNRRGAAAIAAAACLYAALVLITPPAALGHHVVLALSVVLGFHVIATVTPALHTPLMSVTNAISGIVLIGALSQIGHPDPLVAGVAFLATVLAAVNVFGGFAVTHRMLAMFRKD